LSTYDFIAAKDTLFPPLPQIFIAAAASPHPLATAITVVVRTVNILVIVVVGAANIFSRR
jgi:hypothetical protein